MRGNISIFVENNKESLLKEAKKVLEREHSLN